MIQQHQYIISKISILFYINFLFFIFPIICFGSNIKYHYKSPFASNHSNCDVTNWLNPEQSKAINRTNSLMKFVGNSGVLQNIGKRLNYLSLPTPIFFSLRQKFFSILYDIEIKIETIQLSGIRSISLKPIQPLTSTSILNQVILKGVNIELMIEVRHGKKTRQRFGIKYCPGSSRFFGECRMNTAMMKMALDVRDLSINLVTDLWVYDYCQNRRSKFFKSVLCKIKSSWEFFTHITKKGITTGIEDYYLNRIHDAHVRSSSVGFRYFNLDTHIESQLGLLFDKDIITYIRSYLDEQFRDGLYHKSISQSIATAAGNIANDLIDTIKPKFNAQHIYKEKEENVNQDDNDEDVKVIVLNNNE